MKFGFDILTMMKVAAFIPARYASTRLNGKPIASICGKPMVQWVYEAARNASLVNEVTVATDDERIFKAVRSFGGSVVMTSSAHVSGTDRIAEAAASVDADIIVNMQGDEPLITPEVIDAAVRPMLLDPNLSLCTVMTIITDEDEYRDPNAVKVVCDSDGYALYFSRSPIPYSKADFEELKVYKHIGLYVFRRDFLMRFSTLAPSVLEKAESLEQLRALENGCRIKVVETSYNPVSVDTAEDLERVRGIMKGMGL